MIELSTQTAADWLRGIGIPPAQGLFTELGGGVSNRVILAQLADRRIVIKQALGRLRVEREWLSDRSRVFREAAAMRWLEGKIADGHVPRALAQDHQNFIIAMEAAPSHAEMWKEKLFRREFNDSAARSAGRLLGSIVAASWKQPDVQSLFGDQTVFDQLRIDPYYRYTASRHPEVASCFNRLIESSAARRFSLVHGDWSPKNLLAVSSGNGAAEIWAIDWECVHYGDPSYDVAFLLNHLLLKSIAMPAGRLELARLADTFMNSFLTALRVSSDVDTEWMEAAVLEHLPALLLARVEGKSPVEYLDGPMRATAWKLGVDLIARPATSMREIFSR